ncbi:MAG: alpha/beta fold hydrolase [Dehalococcoidia bacterium]
MSKARVNGVELSYAESGSGTPLLFIHGGFGGPQSTLVTQARLVTTILPADRIRTITYDRRGAGQSEYVAVAYSLPDLAADARALLRQLGIERSIVVGDSMGGMVAQQYALSYPETVSALCLVETGADLMSETAFGKQGQAQVERAARDGDRALFESRKDQLRNPPEAPGFGPRTSEMAERMRSMRAAYLAALQDVSDDALCTYFTGMTRNYGAFIGYDFASRLHELKMPVCIIHGNADTTVPFAYARALHQGITQSEFHEIDGAAHGVLAWPGAATALRDWVLKVAG